jgi:hypothetical protein
MRLFFGGYTQNCKGISFIFVEENTRPPEIGRLASFLWRLVSGSRFLRLVGVDRFFGLGLFGLGSLALSVYGYGEGEIEEDR